MFLTGWLLPAPVPPLHIHVQVNYKNVMKQYGLGPNGGILTASNLFATRFDQVWLRAELGGLHCQAAWRL